MERWILTGTTVKGQLSADLTVQALSEGETSEELHLVAGGPYGAVIIYAVELAQWVDLARCAKFLRTLIAENELEFNGLKFKVKDSAESVVRDAFEIVS